MTNHYDEKDEELRIRELRLRLILELRIKGGGGRGGVVEGWPIIWLSLKPQGLRIEDQVLRIN